MRFFILIFVLLGSHLIELIPNTSLAAMLITVGIKLAHPKEFVHTFKIGKEQLLIFLVTIFFTIYDDLLIGIGAGIVLKMVIHLINGVPVSSLFKAAMKVEQVGEVHVVKIFKSAVFTNYLGIKNCLDGLPKGATVRIDLSQTKLVDHSVMESLHHFQHEYEGTGGHVEIQGLEDHRPVSEHEFAARKNVSVVV